MRVPPLAVRMARCAPTAAALLLVVGCTRDVPAGPPATCAGFDTMALTDPDGLASDNDLTRVRSVLDELATATGLDGVCVPEVRIVADGTCADGAENCFQGAGAPILVASSSVWEVREVMCEALEVRLGYDLLDPELFAAAGAASFVQVCTDFPATLHLQASLDDTCAADLGVSPALSAWMLANVFPAWEVPLGAPIDVAFDRHPVAGLVGDLGSFVASGGAFHAWETAPDDPDAASIVRVDDATFTVTARYALPPREEGAQRRMIPTDGAPLLVYTATETVAWRLDEAAGAWVALPFAALEPGTPFSAVGDGDIAWVLGHFPPEPDARLAAVDLATGRATLLDGPTLMGADFLAGDSAQLVGGAATALLQQVLLLVDPAAATYTTVPVPYDWHASYPVRLGERVAAVWQRNDAGSLAVYEPSTGQWRLASDPCGTARITGPTLPASRGDEAWLWEQDATAPGGAWMTEIHLGE